MSSAKGIEQRESFVSLSIEVWQNLDKLLGIEGLTEVNKSLNQSKKREPIPFQYQAKNHGQKLNYQYDYNSYG